MISIAFSLKITIKMKAAFIRAGDDLFPVSSVEHVDLSELERGKLSVTYGYGRVAVAYGVDVFEALMILRPSALEGKRLRWVKNSWWIHNTVGHVGMQLLSWAGFTSKAIWLHDVTIPGPYGFWDKVISNKI